MTQKLAHQENDISDLFNPSDFQSTRLEIKISNTTTNTEIKNGKKYFQGVQVAAPKCEVTITEFIEKGLLMGLPSKTCAQGHNVLVSILISNPRGDTKTSPKQITEFSFSGKVQSIEMLDNDSDSAEIRMVQFDEKSWQEFQSVFFGRQAEIDSFFQGIRG